MHAYVGTSTMTATMTSTGTAKKQVGKLALVSFSQLYQNHKAITRQLRLLRDVDAPNATYEQDLIPGKAICCRQWTYLSLRLIKYSIDCLEGGHGTVDLCGQVLIQWVGGVSIRQFCASTV